MKLETKEFFTSKNSQSEDLNFNKNRLNSREGLRLFLNSNYPDQEVFEKLFLSQLFKLNRDDRAKQTGENIQTSGTGVDKVLGGHVTIASNSEAKNFDNGEELLYTRTVRPSQLPETIEGLNQTITIDDAIFSDVIVNRVTKSNENRNVYQHNLNDNFLIYLKKLIEKSIVPVGTVSQILGTQLDTEKPWLILDGSNISKESKPDSIYVGDKYKLLYFHISRILGVLEPSIQSNWDSNVSVSLPVFDPITNGTYELNYIIKY